MDATPAGGVELGGERFMNEPVAGEPAHPRKRRAHNLHRKMGLPARLRAGMTGVAGAVVMHRQSEGSKPFRKESCHSIANGSHFTPVKMLSPRAASHIVPP